MIVRGLHFSFDAGGDAALATLFYPGAGHFAMCDPVDTISGRSFLEPDSATAGPAVQGLFGDLIAAFTAARLARPSRANMEQLVEQPSVGRWDRR